MLDQLNGDIRIGFDICLRQRILFAEFLVIVQYAVMGKGKSVVGSCPLEWMIVVVILLAALSSESCMSDNRRCVFWEIQLDLVGWLRFLECYDVSILHIAYACCIGASAFCRNR